MSPSNGLQNGGGGGGSGNGVNYIEHPVSKLDTLAGVAIKYGVEVADIKKMNNLATDLQMFALKRLRIPLPGRHPPSPSTPNESAILREDFTQRKKPLHFGQSSTQEPFQSFRLRAPRQKISQAMSTLQSYYGLESSGLRGKTEETEMAVYRSNCSNHYGDEWLQKASPVLDPPSNHLHKSRNLSYDSLSEYEPDEKSVRRRQKAEVDSGAVTPERLLKEANNGATSGFSSSTGKGLAMRAKSASRSVLLAESEPTWLDTILIGLGESVMTDGLSAVRKSSSAASLKEQEKNYSATVWSPAKWSLKPDLQALSSTAIAKPLFDGLPLPIPITGRRNKAALD